jgi:hypothetical protein
MKINPILRRLLVLFVSVATAAQMSADVVETKNGSRIVGKVSKIDGGSVVIATDYAGDLTIKQSEVTSITTDAPVAVRLTTGTRIDGKLSGSAGAVQVAGSDGSLSTTVDKVAASWAAGAQDPAAGAWSYEATADVTGKNGNSDELGLQAAFRATLKSAKDMLQFYTAYDRKETDGSKSSDLFKAGVDYQNQFGARSSWYVRDEGGFDRIKDIGLYNVAAGGFGYDSIKSDNQTLTLRAGVAFRYEDYKNPVTQDIKAVGIDLGLNHSIKWGTSRMVNRITYVPTVEDFANYIVKHESFYEIPLTNPAWKLRLGLTNDYNSEPGKGVEKMDTTYFTRFVLSWK